MTSYIVAFKAVVIPMFWHPSTHHWTGCGLGTLGYGPLMAVSFVTYDKSLDRDNILSDNTIVNYYCLTVIVSEYMYITLYLGQPT